MFLRAARIARVSPARSAFVGLRMNSTSGVVEVSDLAHFNKVIDTKKKLSVVDFYATWCGPCKAIAPVFETLAQKIPEVDFARVDVDRAEDVAQEYAITAMPTILFFQDGEKVDSIVGANMPKLIRTIEEYSGINIKSK